MALHIISLGTGFWDMRGSYQCLRWLGLLVIVCHIYSTNTSVWCRDARVVSHGIPSLLLLRSKSIIGVATLDVLTLFIGFSALSLMKYRDLSLPHSEYCPLMPASGQFRSRRLALFRNVVSYVYVSLLFVWLGVLCRHRSSYFWVGSVLTYGIPMLVVTLYWIVSGRFVTSAVYYVGLA
jgi:hypothetical protein